MPLSSLITEVTAPSPEETTGSMDGLLDTLRQFDALRDQTIDGEHDAVEVRTIPNIEPAFADGKALSGLPPFLSETLARQGITRLYQHQAKAIGHAERRRHRFGVTHSKRENSLLQHSVAAAPSLRTNVARFDDSSDEGSV